MKFEVAVVGLGRVGLPLAARFARRGISVIGIDSDAERLGALKAGRMPLEVDVQRRWPSVEVLVDEHLTS